MIRYKDKIFPKYFIDPVTAVITNSKGEIQETKINEDGRPCFHCMEIHRIQIYTHLCYKRGFDIHHLDHNKMNNALSNLVYLTKSEHTKIHSENMSEETKNKIGEALKGRKLSEETKIKISESMKHMSEDTKKKMSEAKKGKNHPLYGKHHSEETKKKMSESLKRRKNKEYEK